MISRIGSRESHDLVSSRPSKSTQLAMQPIHVLPSIFLHATSSPHLSSLPIELSQLSHHLLFPPISGSHISSFSQLNHLWSPFQQPNLPLQLITASPSSTATTTFQAKLQIKAALHVHPLPFCSIQCTQHSRLHAIFISILVIINNKQLSAVSLQAFCSSSHNRSITSLATAYLLLHPLLRSQLLHALLFLVPDLLVIISCKVSSHAQSTGQLSSPMATLHAHPQLALDQFQ